MEKIIHAIVLSTILPVPIVALAAFPSPYVEGQIGYATTGIGENLEGYLSIIGQSGAAKRLDDEKVIGRLAIGYQVNPCWGVEVGYFQPFTAIKYKRQVTDPVSRAPYADMIKVNSLQSLDLMIKGIIPLTSVISLYGKFGMAYLTFGDVSAKSKRIQDKVYAQYTLAMSRVHTWAPAVAVGISYDLTSTVPITLSFMHIHPVAKVANQITLHDEVTGGIQKFRGSYKPNSINYLALGVGYNFG